MIARRILEILANPQDSVRLWRRLNPQLTGVALHGHKDRLGRDAGVHDPVAFVGRV